MFRLRRHLNLKTAIAIFVLADLFGCFFYTDTLMNAPDSPSIESGAPTPAIPIFVSSPGDVTSERLLAARVINQLCGEFASCAEITSYFWEYEPMNNARTFQEQIPSLHDFEILICVLWSRLGTPLKGPDGQQYASGTEYEVESGLASFERSKRPQVMIFLNQTPVQLKLLQKEDRDRINQQLDALYRFVNKYCFDTETGEVRGAFTAYRDLGQFEDLLEQHLKKCVEKRLSRQLVPRRRIRATWTKGTPFRGLLPFEFEHAPIFRGRARAIGHVIAALRERAQRLDEEHETRSRTGSAGPLREAVFILVSAMSGVGKSSLIRAGVLPLLVEPGDGIGVWRRAVLRASEAAGDLFDGLAQSLVRPDALPELVSPTTGVPRIAEMLRSAPQSVDHIVELALNAASQTLRRNEEDQIRSRLAQALEIGRQYDVERAEQALAALRLKPARLVLVVDQLEELFTLDRVDANQREGYLVALAALSRSRLVWVITTMRNDFFHRCAELPLLMELKSGNGGHYDLAPPTTLELGQIIRQPALAAGLLFDANSEGQPLDERLRDEALAHPEALPLLEYCLEELYQRRDVDGLLTHTAFEELCGDKPATKSRLAGALAKRAEAVFENLNPESKNAFNSVMRAVVTVGIDNGRVFNRRWAEKTLFSVSDGSAGFVENFLAPTVRLFVADQTNAGTPIVSVAHEALLSAWPRLATWLDQNQTMLQRRALVSAEAEQWKKSGEHADYLIHGERRLREAAVLLADWPLGELERRYVESSLGLSQPANRRIRIFISSPGDVGRERILALQIIERLKLEYARRAQLEPYAWEQKGFAKDFQEEIPSPAKFDLVLCILWSRLGTLLPGKSVSGTEYEIREALRSRQAFGQPDLLLFIRKEAPQVEVSEPLFGERIQQFNKLQNFIREITTDPDGTITGAYHSYTELSEFEHQLEVAIRTWLEQRLPPLPADAPPIWTDGNPYCGLRPFDYEHAPVFAGRTRATAEVINLLESFEIKSEPVFALVVGEPRIGKTSLLCAGVLPLLVQIGREKFGTEVRWAVFRPGSRPWFALAQALARLAAPVPLEVTSPILTELTELEARLCERPADAGNVLREVFPLFKEQKDSPHGPRLILIVDQLEEIFTLTNLSLKERASFASLLAVLIADGIWIIAALRSEFITLWRELPNLPAYLLPPSRCYTLGWPTLGEITQMIRQPARAAGFRFEVEPENQLSLDDFILNEAAAAPSTLEMLEYCLTELWHRQRDNILTFDAYRKLGGLKGAIASYAEQLFERLPETARDGFSSVAGALILAPLEPGMVFRRLLVERSVFDGDAAAQELVSSLLGSGGGLLMSHTVEEKEALVLGNDSLLTEWPRLATWLEQNKRKLRIRSMLWFRTWQWDLSDCVSDETLATGAFLEQVIHFLDGFALTAREKAFIRTSAEAVRRRRAVSRRRIVVIVLIVLVAVVIALVLRH
jgi:conflict system STAND superfamily ATPase